MRLLNRRIPILVLALILLIAAELSAVERLVVDQAGREVELPDAIDRIVSLAPSTTEIIFALGKDSLLRGVTQYSDYPPAARSLPRVGSYVRLDLEKIVVLKPDICFAVKDGNPLNTIKRLTELGIPVFAIDVHDTRSVIESIKRVGEVLGVKQVAKNISDDMERRIERVQNTVRQTDYRPNVFIQIAVDPIVSIGSNTVLDELIELAGGQNMAAGPNPYPRYSKEQIVQMNPDVFIVSSMTEETDVEIVKRGWERWRQISAVKNGRIYLINSDLTHRPGPRLVDGLEALALLIHPELFGDNAQR